MGQTPYTAPTRAIARAMHIPPRRHDRPEYGVVRFDAAEAAVGDARGEFVRHRVDRNFAEAERLERPVVEQFGGLRRVSGSYYQGPVGPLVDVEEHGTPRIGTFHLPPVAPPTRWRPIP